MANGDVTEAIGKAVACTAIQGALLATLLKRNLISKEDAATLTGVASAAITAMPGVTDDAKVLAQAALRGFASTYLKGVTRN